VQQQVVALPDEADAVVLGAAGTGKTSVLVELVAERVLTRGWDPGAIVAIAASRRAAAALRDRIAARLGVVTPGPMARTAASLAHGIVARAAAAAGDPPPRYVSGADHDRIVAELLAEEIERDADGYWPASIGRAVRGLAAFRSELRDFVARATERGLRPEAIAALGAERDRPEWIAMSRFLPALAARIELEHRGFTPLDSAYVLRRAAELAAAGDPVAAGLRLVVVDDAQELGRGALELVRSLAAGGARVVALGDPDLATGGFRGAAPGGFLEAAFWAAAGRPRPAPLVLPTAHRQTAGVRAALAAVTGAVGAAGAGPQRAAAAASPGGRALSVSVADAADLMAFLARAIRERAVAGTPWGRMAVVARNGGSVPRLARELRGLDVPAAGAGISEVRRDDWAVQSLVELLRIAIDGARTGTVAVDPAGAELLLTGSVGRLDALALRRLRAALRRQALIDDPDDVRRGSELLAEAIATPGGFAMLEPRPETRAADRVAGLLHAAVAGVRAGRSAEELLWDVWAGSGLERSWGAAALGTGLAADEADRHLDSVLAVFEAAKRYVEREPDGSAARFIEDWARAQVEEDSLAPRASPAAVAVGTPAALIGQEYDVVFIADLQEGVWPNPRVRGSVLRTGELVELADGIDPASIDRRREVLSDELRLLAAAIGKAAGEVVAVCVEGEEDAPSPFVRLLPEHCSTAELGEDAVAPLTLRGLVGRLRRELVRTGDPAAAAALARLAAEAVPGAHPDDWFGLAPPTTLAPLRPDDEEVPVHPSELGTFIECPLHWALRHLGGDAGSAAASLGTIVHDAAHAIAGSEEPVGVLRERIAATLRSRWPELEFESGWLERKEWQRAEAIAERLADYQAGLVAAGGGTLASETRLRLAIERAVLSGRIDRVERVVEDETARIVVVDFKTGAESRAETRDQLEGHPQLATYQLALAAGAIEGVDPTAVDGAELGGARLVVLSPRARRAIRPQLPLDAERARYWTERIAEAAEGMAGRTFVAFADSHCLGWGGGGLCPIHVVEAVSA